jgi:hypothetical protein
MQKLVQNTLSQKDVMTQTVAKNPIRKVTCDDEAMPELMSVLVIDNASFYRSSLLRGDYKQKLACGALIPVLNNCN